MEITKDQLKLILQKAPKGSDPKQIIKALQDKGHTIEGLQTVAQFQQQSPTVAGISELAGGKIEATKQTLKEAEAISKAETSTKEVSPTVSGVLGLTKEAKIQEPEIKFKESIEQAKEKLTEGMSVGTEVLTGVAKGATSTAVSGSELFQKTLAAPFIKDVEFMGEIDRPQILVEATTPEGTAQKIGFTAEQIGEFFIPGAVGIKTSKLITGLPKVASVGEKLIHLAKVATLEGSIFGGVTAIQTAGDVGETGTAAVIGASFPLVGALLKPIGKFIAQKLPSRLINSLIKPPQKEFLFGKNPGAAIANEKITANTLEGLLTKTRAKLIQLSDELTDHVKDIKGNVNAETIINNILNSEAGKIVDEQGRNRLLAVLDDIFKKTEFKNGKFIQTGVNDLTKLTAEELRALQQKIGKLTQWTGQAYEKQPNAVLSKIYTTLGKELDNLAPGSKVLQQRIANLLGATKSIESRVATASRLAQLGLMGSIAGTAGFVTGEGKLDQATRALIGFTLIKVGASPAVKSRVASALANATMKELPEVLKQLAKAGLIVGFRDEKSLEGEE